MNKKRLTKLAEFLRTVPPERFNLSIWGDEHFFNSNRRKGCGCAIGWACEIFPELSLVRSEDTNNFYPSLEGDGTYFKAVATLFEIKEKTAEYLFDPSFYQYDEQTSENVVQRIYDVMEEGEYEIYYQVEDDDYDDDDEDYDDDEDSELEDSVLE